MFGLLDGASVLYKALDRFPVVSCCLPEWALLNFVAIPMATGCPEVSIIMPVYNCAPWLPACLDSIRAQTFTDWECLCVDDGSRDGSASLLADLTARDARFRVLRQPSRGTSVARNLGLDASSGEFIYFCDADDRMHPRLLELAVGGLRGLGGDFAAFGFTKVSVDVKPDFDRTGGLSIWRPLDAPLRYYLQHHFQHNVWQYVVRRRAIGNLRFKPDIKHQDLLFTYQLLKGIRSGLITSAKLYQYVQTPHSIIRSPIKAENLTTIFDILVDLDAFYEDSPALQGTMRRTLFPDQVKDCLKKARHAPEDCRPALERLVRTRTVEAFSAGRIGLRGFSFRGKCAVLTMLLLACLKNGKRRLGES